MNPCVNIIKEVVCFFTVVENILSKSKHNVFGHSLKLKLFDPTTEADEQYELDKIKIKMTPSISEKHLRLYLPLEEEEFTLQMFEDSCLVIFNSKQTLTSKYCNNTGIVY